MRATLRGWRRVWRQTDLRDVAYLTAVPDENSRIEGMIAAVPAADWRALDIREDAYERVSATDQVDHPLPDQPQIAVYSIPEGKHGQPLGKHPVLLSYLDVVVQGYLREFGTAGAGRFFASTDGWDVPVLDDRADPIYPRHCRLTREETDFVDRALAELAVTLTRP